MQGRAGDLPRTTKEQRLMGPRPSECGEKLIKHETFQSLNNLYFQKLFRAGGGGGGA